MTLRNRREPLLLLLVDVSLFLVALWLMLLFRFLEIPSLSTFYNHLAPFSFLFLVWVLVFFVAGLYDHYTIIFRDRLPGTILNVQTVNIIIAALFFFFIPYFGVTPKTSLGIYLIVSSALILVWRLVLYPRLSLRKPKQALLVGSGEELTELEEEVRASVHYPFAFTEALNSNFLTSTQLLEDIEQRVASQAVDIVILNTSDEKIVEILPRLYPLILDGVELLEAAKVYEEVFGREPLSLIEHRWLIEHVRTTPQVAYDIGKRTIDLIAGSILGVLSLICYPLVWLAIKIDDGGPVFFVQERVGAGNRLITLFKFRSMSLTEKEKVTRVGALMRKTRIDELPQLWNVLRGDLSLIGPRPELPELAVLYTKHLPYYPVRHLITPGLSGWAQIHDLDMPHGFADVEKTARKLSYDLYYIKHRSLWLDIKISLKTFKTVLSQSGL